MSLGFLSLGCSLCSHINYSENLVLLALKSMELSKQMSCIQAQMMLIIHKS